MGKKRPVRVPPGERYPCPDPQEKAGKHIPQIMPFFPDSRITAPQRK